MAIKLHVNGGFTVLELLVVVTLMTIMLSLAVPSFTSFIDQQRVNQQVKDFRAAASLARSEAVKRKSKVYLQAEGGNWSNGWLVTLDDDDTFSSCGSCLAIFQSSGAFSAVESASVVGFYFNQSGRPSESGVEVTFCDQPASSRVKKQVLRIKPSGTTSVEKEGSCL